MPGRNSSSALSAASTVSYVTTPLTVLAALRTSVTFEGNARPG